jgi:hypothetical protein
MMMIAQTLVITRIISSALAKRYDVINYLGWYEVLLLIQTVLTPGMFR